MINTDRIVQVAAIDLLSLYALILKLTGKTITVANASTTDGQFDITEAPDSGSLMASEPVQSLNFSEDVTAATVYFVPAYDYTGFSLNGVAVETTGNEVVADGRSLYLATLASGAVTIAAQGV